MGISLVVGGVSCSFKGFLVFSLAFFLIPFSGSPFRVPVKDMVNSSKVKLSGPGVGSGVRAKIPQSFTVDCSKAGIAPLSVAVTGPKGEMLFCTVRKAIS